jgi:hypothetical protein
MWHLGTETSDEILTDGRRRHTSELRVTAPDHRMLRGGQGFAQAECQKYTKAAVTFSLPGSFIVGRQQIKMA